MTEALGKGLLFPWNQCLLGVICLLGRRQASSTGNLNCNDEAKAAVAMFIPYADRTKAKWKIDIL